MPFRTGWEIWRSALATELFWKPRSSMPVCQRHAPSILSLFGNIGPGLKTAGCGKTFRSGCAWAVMCTGEKHSRDNRLLCSLQDSAAAVLSACKYRPPQLLSAGRRGPSTEGQELGCADGVGYHYVQELRGSALQLLATGLAASPRVSGARSEHWPSIKIALEGLGLSAEAVSACKIWLLQVHYATSMHSLSCRPSRSMLRLPVS